MRFATSMESETPITRGAATASTDTAPNAGDHVVVLLLVVVVVVVIVVVVAVAVAVVLLRI